MRSKKDEIICGNVLRLLNETGMTKADLARKTDMTPQAINSLKINGIGSKSIQKLAYAFGVTEEELINKKAEVNVHSPPDKKEDNNLLLRMLVSNVEDQSFYCNLERMNIKMHHIKSKKI